MILDIGSLLGGAVAACVALIGGIVWLVRLEGRVNTAAATIADLTKDFEAHKADSRADIAAVKARAEADSAAHSETTLALVRVQEQLKYLTSLFERHFVAAPPTRSRTAREP